MRKEIKMEKDTEEKRREGKRRLRKIAAYAGLGCLQEVPGDPQYHEYFISLPAAHPLAPLHDDSAIVKRVPQRFLEFFHRFGLSPLVFWARG